jgi:hypothetical protein
MHMIKQPLALLAGLALAGLAACEGHSAPAAGPETGYATGTVVDTQGKPITGAKILLENSVFYAAYIDGSSDTDGRYRIKAQPGAWKAHASIRKTYNGKAYTLALQPDNPDSFDGDGAVRNFTWKLEGRTPGNAYGYYGGFIQLSTDIGFHEDMEHIELTLTPSGPLIDGSEGTTLRLRLGDHYWIDRYQIEDIPIGRYRVEATLNDAGSSRRLRIQDWRKKGEFKPEFQLDFTPKPAGATDNSASIVIGY